MKRCLCFFDTVRRIICFVIRKIKTCCIYVGIINLCVDPPDLPWVVMGTAAVTSIPTLLFYFKEEPTKLQARIRIVIHFCLIQAIVMTEGFLLGWYKNFPMALLVFAMITAVYLLTFLFSYITRTRTAKSINESLKKFNADEDYQDE